MSPTEPEQPETRPVAPPGLSVPAAPIDLPTPTQAMQQLPPAQDPWYPAGPPPVPTAGYQVPLGGVPTPPPRGTSLRPAAVLVLIGLGASIITSLADTVLTPWAVVEELDSAQVESNPIILAAGGLALLQILAIVVTAASFITWLFLARRNLRTWRIDGLGWGPGWAIGGWFIPLANLFIPPQVVRTVARGSAIPPNQSYAPEGGSGLVWVWWICWIGANFASNIFISQNFTKADSVSYIAGLNAISTVLSIVAATLAIVLVLRITGQQERRQDTLDQWWQQAGSWPPQS